MHVQTHHLLPRFTGIEHIVRPIVDRRPVFQPVEDGPLNHNQREIDHMMRCSRKGCTRCEA